MGQRYTNLYCIRCGASQLMDGRNTTCGAVIKGKRCDSAGFTSAVGLVNWDSMNDRDAEFLRSIRIRSREKESV